MGLVVRDGANLDFETISAYTFAVDIADASNPSLRSSMTVDVNLLDVNDPPRISTSGDVWNITENILPGTRVGTIAVSDDDGDEIELQVAASVDGPAFGISANASSASSSSSNAG